MDANFKPGDKPKGWFSRRHTTNEAHKRAVNYYDATHFGAKLREGNSQGHTEHKTAEQVRAQIQKLDERLGEGVGATAERQRLADRLTALGA